MKNLNDSFFFVPRMMELIDLYDIPFTADTTDVTADSTTPTADMTVFAVKEDFVVEMTDELTKEVFFPEYEWEIVGNFIKVTFDEQYSENYSIHIYNLEGFTIYKGRFGSEEYKTEITNDNKLYL